MKDSNGWEIISTYSTQQAVEDGYLVKVDYLSIDSKTNEMIPLRSSYIQIPEKIKGATLSAE